MTLSFNCILCIFLNSLVVCYYPTVYKNTTRGTTFTSNTLTYDHIVLVNFYGFKVYFTTFVQSLIYVSYSNDWGGAMW